MIKYKLVQRYAHFVSHHPFIVILIVIILSIFSIYGAKNVKTSSMSYSDMLPNDIEEINALNIIKDEFGGTDNIMIVVEVDKSSDISIIKDIRDPQVIRYLYHLTEIVKRIDGIVSAESAASLIKDMNNGTLPQDLRTIQNFYLRNPILSQYINNDYSMAIINLKLSDDINEDEIIRDLNNAINSIEKPTGLTVNLAGEFVAGPIVRSYIAPDMQRTSNIALIGIVVILLILFRSVKYGLTPLLTIIVGVLWAFGFMGIMNIGINSATSGVISMIMGIGIDFGIQVITRFREESLRFSPKKAMEVTLVNVFIPMATTTVAALIGFRAMTLGKLTIMAELGKIMSYGIAACFLVSVTLIPAIMVIIDNRIYNRIYNKNKLIKKSAEV